VKGLAEKVGVREIWGGEGLWGRLGRACQKGLVFSKNCY